eukprot:TRINITY_DN3993_c0_g1_i2.p1 TRINITY_DN3993_c0_g1~~TRINITY_DN3993_c0_g1_i2.p1  ORF type:complete len:505 (-),score=146.13 TRINITY_DN3993_c0_g1_i2:182-1642(-)
MSQLFGLCSLLFFAFFSTAQTSSLQFSHQAPLLEDNIDLLINGQVVPEFVNVSYAEVTGFVDILPYQEDAESSLFTLTVQSATTGEQIATGDYDVSQNYASFFVANSPEEENEVQTIFASVVLDQPTEFYGWVRFVNLAPTDDAKTLRFDGADQQTLEWGEFTPYVEYRNGEYLFEVVETEAKELLATLNLIVASGEIITVIFNGEGDNLSPFSLEPNLDLDFHADYSECYVRFVNSVSDVDVTPYFVPGDIAPFEEVQYGTATDYQPLLVGDYALFLDQDETGVFVNFTCESSHAYTFTFQGEELSSSLSVLHDRVLKPLYLEAGVRVDLLITSENETPYNVTVDGETFESLTFAEPSNYFKVVSTTPTISITQGDTVIYEQQLELTLGETFSWFLLGSVDASTALLTSDSEGVSPVDPTTTTTTTTTTGSTTGGATTSAPEDEDDDDGLSGGAVAGIVIAVLIIVFVLVVGLVWFLRHRGFSQT